MNTKTLLIHNPGCSKSRGAKEILEEKGIAFEAYEYLKAPLSKELLKELPQLLGLDYPQMIRTGEQVYTELNLNNRVLTSEDWVRILQEHPILIERPIFIHQQRAVIARPPEKVLEILT